MIHLTFLPSFVHIELCVEDVKTLVARFEELKENGAEIPYDIYIELYDGERIEAKVSDVWMCLWPTP